MSKDSDPKWPRVYAYALGLLTILGLQEEGLGGHRKISNQVSEHLGFLSCLSRSLCDLGCVPVSLNRKLDASFLPHKACVRMKQLTFPYTLRKVKTQQTLHSSKVVKCTQRRKAFTKQIRIKRVEQMKFPGCRGIQWNF